MYNNGNNYNNYNNGQNNQGYSNPMDLYSNSNNINYNENYTGVNQNSFEEPREKINIPYLIRKNYMITTIFAIIGFLLSFYFANKIPFNISMGINTTLLIISIILPILSLIFREIKVPLILVNIVLMLTTYGLTAILTSDKTADSFSFTIVLLCICVCINGMAWQGIKLLFNRSGKQPNLGIRELLCFFTILIISIISGFILNIMATGIEDAWTIAFFGFFISFMYILVISLQIDKVYKNLYSEDYVAITTYNIHMGVLMIVFVIIFLLTGEGGQVSKDYKQIKKARKINYKGDKNMFD